MALIRNCYIAAPAGLDVSRLTNLLKSKGVRLVGPKDTPSLSAQDSTAEAISSADLVVGVLTRERDSQWVLFELGQAHILGKRLLIVAYPSAGNIPSQFRKLLFVRSNLTELGAVEFALDQVLAAPDSHDRKADSKKASERPVDRQAITNLKEVAGRGLESHLMMEGLVAQALRAAGAEVVVESEGRDGGADLAVWSDQWSPSIANPLLVEIKTAVRGRGEAERVAAQLSKYVARGGSNVGLLVVADGADEFLKIPKSKLKRVVVMSLEDLIEGLEGVGLHDTILDELMNKRLG